MPKKFKETVSGYQGIKGNTGVSVDLPVFRTDHVVEPIVIEQGVDIGANSVILPGVTIGTNSIIGAGAVVNKDIPPGVIAAGVPARVIRCRGEETGKPENTL